MNNIEILEDYKKLMENLYRFIDDDMGGHFEPVVGNQKANTMLGYLVFERELENLIQENKELKEKQKEYEKQLDLDYVENNYIPKSKLKEKIERLNNGERIKFYTEDKKHYYETNSFNEAIKYVLQEFLEGE